MEEYWHSKEYEDEIKYLYHLYSLAWKVKEAFDKTPLISKDNFVCNSKNYFGGNEND